MITNRSRTTWRRWSISFWFSTRPRTNTNTISMLLKRSTLMNYLKKYLLKLH